MRFKKKLKKIVTFLTEYIITEGVRTLLFTLNSLSFGTDKKRKERIVHGNTRRATQTCMDMKYPG